MISDFSIVVNAFANRKSINPKKIGEFCYKNVYEEISN